jgi:long-chain acyl-CoA synthetase
MLSLVGERTFPNVIRLHFAGGRFPQSDLPRLRELFPNAAIFNNYGCAEAMPRLTVRAAEESDEPALVGHPLPGIEMRTGVASNAEGAPIEFRSIYRAAGIVEANGFRWIADDEWIASGDLGEQLSDGRWRLLGRSNEVFKRFGEKISIPVLLRQVSEVWPNAAAFYTEIDKYNETAHVLVMAPHPSDADVKGLLQHLRKSYGRPHWPIRIESLPSLPLSVNNKIDVAALAASDDKKVQWTLRY